jgi:quercetin dioxygenase-like cupin family protein
MALLAKGHEVQEGENVLQVRGGRMSTKMVYGNDCNLMVAVRAPGYHSNPHVHDAEQINYVTEGEIWVFVKDRAFLVQAGDFFRIPRNAVHWAWNRSDRDCTIVEVHAPVVDPLRRRAAVGLYDEGETPDLGTAVATIRVGDDAAAIEQRLFGEEAGRR